MKSLKLMFASVVALGMLAFSSPAAAAVIFLGSAPTSGTIFYSGGATALVGSGISLDLLVGSDTAANDGVAGLCVSCFLDFTTGPFVFGDPTFWLFDAGGSITVTGGIDFNFDGDTDDPNELAVGTPLLTGSFAPVSFTVTDGAVPFAGINISPLFSVIDPTLATFYQEFTSEGLLLINFVGVGTAPGAFVSTEIGSLLVSTIPEPASLLVWGAAAAGLMARKRKRSRAAKLV